MKNSIANKNISYKRKESLLGFILIFAFCISSFSAHGKDDFLIDKEIRICGNNTLPINLNTAIGVALSNKKGSWLDKNGRIVSNVFILPEDNAANEYVFCYFVNKADAYCGLEKNDKYRIKIRVEDKLIIALQQDPNCEEKIMNIKILRYNTNLKYFIEPQGLQIDDDGIIWNVDPNSNFSIYATDGYCISEATKLIIDELPEDCYDSPCTELWDKVRVNQFISPNGDEHNDALIINGLEQFYASKCAEYSDVNLLIFNRWGDLVYEKKNYMKDEQELFRGFSTNSLDFGNRKPLPMGTYFYLLRSGEETVKTGFIQIVGD